MSCFDTAFEHVMILLDKEYFREFVLSECYAKYQVDVLTSAPVQMSDILYNDALLFHFMEFMEGEGDRDLLEFWITANNFRENSCSSSSSNSNGSSHDNGGQSSSSEDLLQSDALIIYERFVSMQASSPLGTK